MTEYPEPGDTVKCEYETVNGGKTARVEEVVEVDDEWVYFEPTDVFSERAVSKAAFETGLWVVADE